MPTFLVVFLGLIATSLLAQNLRIVKIERGNLQVSKEILGAVEFPSTQRLDPLRGIDATLLLSDDTEVHSGQNIAKYNSQQLLDALTIKELDTQSLKVALKKIESELKVSKIQGDSSFLTKDKLSEKEIQLLRIKQSEAATETLQAILKDPYLKSPIDGFLTIPNTPENTKFVDIADMITIVNRNIAKIKLTTLDTPEIPIGLLTSCDLLRGQALVGKCDNLHWSTSSPDTQLGGWSSVCSPTILKPLKNGETLRCAFTKLSLPNRTYIARDAVYSDGKRLFLKEVDETGKYLRDHPVTLGPIQTKDYVELEGHKNDHNFYLISGW